MSVCPVKVLSCTPLPASHTTSVPSCPALTSSSPSGLNARERIGEPGCATLLHRHCSLESSQTLTTPTGSPLASSRPVGLKAAAQNSLCCSYQILRQRPVGRSHSRIDPSSPHVATSLPAGCTTTE